MDSVSRAGLQVVHLGPMISEKGHQGRHGGFIFICMSLLKNRHVLYLLPYGCFGVTPSTSEELEDKAGLFSSPGHASFSPHFPSFRQLFSVSGYSESVRS